MFSGLAIWQESRINPQIRYGPDWFFFAAAVLMLTLTWPFWLLRLLEEWK